MNALQLSSRRSRWDFRSTAAQVLTLLLSFSPAVASPQGEADSRGTMLRSVDQEPATLLVQLELRAEDRLPPRHAIDPEGRVARRALLLEHVFMLSGS